MVYPAEIIEPQTQQRHELLRRGAFAAIAGSAAFIATCAIQTALGVAPEDYHRPVHTCAKQAGELLLQPAELTNNCLRTVHQSMPEQQLATNIQLQDSVALTTIVDAYHPRAEIAARRARLAGGPLIGGMAFVSVIFRTKRKK